MGMNRIENSRTGVCGNGELGIVICGIMEQPHDILGDWS